VGLNKILIIGNLGTDPEMRYTPNGNPVTSFNVATNRNYTTSQGEKREETEWFRVVTWNQLAEQCNQYLTKGRKVYVEGRLKSDTWTGNDGQVRFTNEISANQVVFLDRGSPGEPGQEIGVEAGGAQDSAVEAGGAPDSAEDLPW
jgi:single-strand DNA-binding protein